MVNLNICFVVVWDLGFVAVKTYSRVAGSCLTSLSEILAPNCSRPAGGCLWLAAAPAYNVAV